MTQQQYWKSLGTYGYDESYDEIFIMPKYQFTVYKMSNDSTRKQMKSIKTLLALKPFNAIWTICDPDLYVIL